MASKRPHVQNTISLKTTDDFSLIKGIGTVLASRLHKAGIHSYHQLVSLSPAELANLVPGLSTKQITRQDWNGQARRLAAKKPRPKSNIKEVPAPIIRQHYENFTVECLMDEKNKMRRTRVIHIQSGDADTWAGWEPGQLIDFVARHAHIKSSLSSLTDRREFGESTPELQARKEEQVAVAMINTPVMTPSSRVSELVHTKIEAVNPEHSSAGVDTANPLRLQNLNATLPDSDLAVSFLRAGQPYLLQLIIDFTDATIQGNGPFNYDVTVHARQLGGAICTAGEASGQLYPHMSSALSIPGKSLSPGIFRLEAYMTLFFENGVPRFTAFLEAGLLQVY